MYKWYYGADYCPEKHDRKNAIVEMVLSIAGCAALYVGWFAGLLLWLKGLI